MVDTSNIETAALKLYDIKGRTTVKLLNNGHAQDPLVERLCRLFCRECV